MADEEEAFDLDPEGARHGVLGEKAVFPAGADCIAGQIEFAFEAAQGFVQVEGRPDVGEHHAVGLREVFFGDFAQEESAQLNEGIVEAAESELVDAAVELRPVDIVLMTAAEHHPVENVAPGEAFVEEVGVGVLDKEEGRYHHGRTAEAGGFDCIFAFVGFQEVLEQVLEAGQEGVAAERGEETVVLHHEPGKEERAVLVEVALDLEAGLFDYGVAEFPGGVVGGGVGVGCGRGGDGGRFC